jgi:methylenetetrahydrofolate dehydrogenase (NADP+)/methenyltetrahydrofolate cyclohydrolase
MRDDMSARIIDGKAVAEDIRDELRSKIDYLKGNGVEPSLTAILVGDNPASAQYVKMKARACAAVGIRSEVIGLPATTSEEELIDLIKSKNEDAHVQGILVQLPLPDHIDQLKINLAVDIDKDVDGFHPVNLGRLVLNRPVFIPATPLGILELIHRTGISMVDKHTVILGRGDLVGRPFSILASLKRTRCNGTVTLCHSGTPNIGDYIRSADILICAMGKAESVTGEMVKPGAVVIDAGTSSVDDPSSKKGYRLVGDAHFESVSKVAGFITPVPGGVGPMTIAMLLSNTVMAAERTLNND